MRIPLAKPFWTKKEENAATHALRYSTGVGDGPYSKKLVSILQKLTKSPFVFPVTSCTHGLELALQSLRGMGRLGDRDEVIIPSFTMSSTANCVVLAGAKPVFADIEKTYYCIDPFDIERKISKRTRGMIIVHYAGMPCQMEEILNIAKKHALFLVEDAAHAIGATYKGKHLGTFGDVGVYSFHGTKNISCGEGGAVLVKDEHLAKYMEIYRANGTNRNAYIRGEVDKYSWVGKGSSYFLSDILSSIVTTQLHQINKINKLRNQIASFYTKQLSVFEKQGILQLPRVPKDATPNWHIYALKFYNKHHADACIKKMRDKGIEVSRHFVPLHSSRMGKKITTHRSLLPVTDTISRTLVRLPIYPGLRKNELRYISSSIQNILESMH
ncbi:dTDP-4-amino-4,6-dideoxygalactose transaminase [Candidatus Gottesmanbacteria bacterium]|nr:dTDP-4-amino-4,6-dideoxygalactose transaminase [Candidatus Gottesmanbacteria bacterium]